MYFLEFTLNIIIIIKFNSFFILKKMLDYVNEHNK